MKKILVAIFAGIALTILFPFNADAKNISSLDVTSSNNKLKVFGTTEDGVLAIAVMVYSGENLEHLQTCSSDGNKFSCELNKTFETGEYIIKVADYNGGTYSTKNISIIKDANGTNGLENENNPQTLDNILLYVGLGGISTLGIIGSILFLKQKKKTN